jgi:hypothetical protein
MERAPFDGSTARLRFGEEFSGFQAVPMLRTVSIVDPNGPETLQMFPPSLPISSLIAMLSEGRLVAGGDGDTMGLNDDWKGMLCSIRGSQFRLKNELDRDSDEVGTLSELS